MQKKENRDTKGIKKSFIQRRCKKGIRALEKEVDSCSVCNHKSLIKPNHYDDLSFGGIKL